MPAQKGYCVRSYAHLYNFVFIPAFISACAQLSFFYGIAGSTTDGKQIQLLLSVQQTMKTAPSLSYNICCQGEGR